MAKNRPNSPYDNPTGVGRRDFIGQLFRELVRPVAEFRNAVNGVPAVETVPTRSEPEPTAATTWLRPPSVVNEWLFLATCERSGECVRVCPANAIRRFEDGTPYIAPAEQPCVVCNDLACLSACPSGALKRVPATALGMGTVRVDETVCLRSQDVDCRSCIEGCPLTDLGIRVLDVTLNGRVLVDESACVGCGCCERACPTEPRAITVVPSRELTP
jgi:ferredoxin-type protein NapG